MFNFYMLLYVSTEVDFVAELYNLSPIIGLLVVAVITLAYVVKKMDDKIIKKEEELKELHNYLRDNDAENIKMLENLSNTIDKVIEQGKHGNSIVLKELDNLKQIISLKIDNIK